MAMTTLQYPDYIILAVFLAASLGIGLYHSFTGGRQQTTKEFIMANRRLGVIPTAISLFISYQSAIAILGATAEMYQFGAQFFLWEPIAVAIATLLSERLFVPWIYPLKLMSINDYLERRYESKVVRILGSIISIADMVFYMGVTMYAPSVALETATGLPIAVSIPLMAVVSVTYTALGGMRAVIWTDVLQFAVFIGGLLAIFIKGMLVMGGYQNVMDICDSEGRLELAKYSNGVDVSAIFTPERYEKAKELFPKVTASFPRLPWSLNPTVRHTVWGFVFGRAFAWTRYSGLTQAAVQRYSAVESLGKARITVLLNIPAIFLLFFLNCSNGLTVFAYYSTMQCDPLANKDVSNANQLLSLFVMTIFTSWHGFAGLFLATLFGGALSSVSSSLSGAAANCWDDILRPKLSELEEHRKALLNRFLVLIFGALAMGMAFLAASVPGPVTQISTTFGNSVFSPLYGIFILGGISRFANWKGAVIGGIGSLCINMWLNIGALTMNWPLPTLPPTATNGCQPLTSGENETWMLSTTAALNDGYFTPSYFYDDNNTTIASSLTVQKELVGIQKFYGLSYMWYSLFGVINTLIIGTIASLIFRDRDAESRVEDHLLIPFRQFFRCSSSGEDEPSASDIKSTVADAAADVESVASGEQEDATDSTVDEVAKL